MPPLMTTALMSTALVTLFVTVPQAKGTAESLLIVVAATSAGHVACQKTSRVLSKIPLYVRCPICHTLYKISFGTFPHHFDCHRGDAKNLKVPKVSLTQLGWQHFQLHLLNRSLEDVAIDCE